MWKKARRFTRRCEESVFGKAAFPGYYRLSEAEFATLWKDAAFVLDANVLLNLHRYPEKAREDLLKVLQKIAAQLWIPHQAALEYQRNRQTVIADQRSRFADVRKILETAQQNLESELQQLQLKRRHSNINPDSFTKKLVKLTGEFTAELDALEKAHTANVEKDELRERIENLFEGRLGQPPADQKTLDTLYKEGEERFAKFIPPGYLDRKKEKDKQGDDYAYGGLSYKRKFGDFIVWKQILDHAKTKALKNVIFVTDDDKDDWWWCVESQGRKKLGPRPELVEEIKREAAVERFHMYSSEQFLEFADTHLKVKVSKDSIAQVTESKAEARRLVGRASEFMGQEYLASLAVRRWLVRRFSESQIVENERGFPDFVVELESGGKMGVEVTTLRGTFTLLLNRFEKVFRGHYEITSGRLNRCMFVFVLVNDRDEERTLRMIRSRLRELPPEVEIQIGRLSGHDEQDVGFEPLDRII